MRRNTVLAIVLLIGLTFSACGGKPTPTVTPTPTVPQAAVDAIKSLRRMKSATEVGITYVEYGTRIIDLKGDVDEALTELPEGELKQVMGWAMEAYGDALVAWSHVAQGHHLLIDYEPAKSLQKKYSIPEVNNHGGDARFTELTRETALSIIWAAAAQHVARASELVGQK